MLWLSLKEPSNYPNVLARVRRNAKKNPPQISTEISSGKYKTKGSTKNLKVLERA